MSKKPNPQGKGLVPVLDNLAACQARISATPKYLEQISNELFTSLFVLSSKFSFRPVVGTRYWLYRRAGVFRLSLVAPEEWQTSTFGEYIGKCRLQDDITWTLELSEMASTDIGLHNYLQECEKSLKDSLVNAEKVDDVLPVYMEGLPFYQRALASGLASSLKASMRLSGIAGLGYTSARLVLPDSQSE